MRKEELKKRLFRAWSRRVNIKLNMPSEDIIFFTKDGKEYAVLYNVDGILAIYRVFKDGRIRFSEEMTRKYRTLEELPL